LLLAISLDQIYS